jgi:hypothetical protein
MLFGLPGKTATAFIEISFRSGSTLASQLLHNIQNIRANILLCPEISPSRSVNSP